jgi:hypothetical protein
VVLNRAFAKILAALSAEKVQSLVVGAYAMAAHGVPRATGDIDIFIRPSATNGRRVLRALARFGAPRFDLTLADLSREGTVFQLGVPPGRIDLLTSIVGIIFDEPGETRVIAVVSGVEIPVLGRDALVRNKRGAIFVDRRNGSTFVCWISARVARRRRAGSARSHGVHEESGQAHWKLVWEARVLRGEAGPWSTPPAFHPAARTLFYGATVAVRYAARARGSRHGHSR